MNHLFTRFLLLGLMASGAMAAEKPNVLVIYVDDLGYGDTAVYGHPVVSTPNIDQLAAQGLRFTQFYAPSSLCSPSRAGLLTGRTPYRTGVQSWIPDGSKVALNANEVTLAQLVKPLGYRTAVVGKWHLNGGLGMSGTTQPRDFGFDYQYGLDAWVKNVPAEKAGTGPLYPDNVYENNVPVGETTTYSAELVSDAAIDWLGENPSEPFLLLLTYSEVHTPIASPPSYVALYDEFLTDESRNFPERYYMNWLDRPHRGSGEYYANITYLDAQMGRVIQYLKETGRFDDTLVIFSSDNGPVTADAEEAWEVSMAGETNGLRGKKRYLFEGGIRVPGIMRWPDHIPAGEVRSEPATALDVLPTIAEVLDIDLGDLVLDGQSITPTWRHEPIERRQMFYWSIPTPDGMEYAVREGDWKLILDPDGKPVYLFDLSQDHYEVVNRIEQKPDIAARLSRQFEILRRSVES